LWLDNRKTALLAQRNELAIPKSSFLSRVVPIPRVTLLLASPNFHHPGTLAFLYSSPAV
jgi:hypothetical protein